MKHVTVGTLRKLYLELGTYTVTCKVISPTNKTVTATKDNVKVTTLASTTVSNASNENVQAKAIYSEYDLAYFRDLVNAGQTAINGKMMNDIDLINVCSKSVGSWNPIAMNNDIIEDNDIINEKMTYKYSGIYDGQNKTIFNLYISNSNNLQGLFGTIIGCVKNLNVQAIISGNKAVGIITGTTHDDAKIYNCHILNNSIINGVIATGGIAGYISDNSKIENCSNRANVIARDTNSAGFGGIAGQLGNNSIISKCYNYGRIGGVLTILPSEVGGIVGCAFQNMENNQTEIIDCYNKGDIYGNSHIGGIIGNSREHEYNSHTIISNVYNLTSVSGNNNVGGIAGNFGKGSLNNAYNIGTVTNNNGDNTGGILGKCGILGNDSTSLNLYDIYNEGIVVRKK